MRLMLAIAAVAVPLVLSACGTKEPVAASSSATGPPAQVGGHPVDELTRLLPSTAPDRWTIAGHEPDGSDGPADDSAPILRPLDPSAVTEPAGCAAPIKPSSVEWAASVAMRSNGINTITSRRDGVVITVGVLRPDADVFAEYRASLNRCKIFHVTAALEVRQELSEPNVGPSDNAVGSNASFLQEPRRAAVYQTILAQRGDVIVKAFATEYSEDVAVDAVNEALRKIKG